MYLSLARLADVQCAECDWTGPFDVDGMRAVLCRQCSAELVPDALAGTETWEAPAGDAADCTGLRFASGRAGI